jgi:hypothetical protein
MMRRLLPLSLVLLAADPAPVRVAAGVYPVGDREVWTGGFTLDGAVGAPDSCAGRSLALPLADERRIAAKNPAFVPSKQFEALETPADGPCEYSMAVVEAEGIEGYVWFGGWGEHLGESEIIASQGDVRDGVIRIHMNPWAFWGDDAKPAPRGERCIVREPVTPSPAWVDASSVNVRGGRGTQFAQIHKVLAGTELAVLHREGDWAWVTAPKEVEDTSGSEPTTHSCTVQGWVKSEFLATVRPEPLPYVQQAEAELASHKPADAVTPLERAAALLPHDVAVREALAEVYAATKHDGADVVARQAARLRKASPAVGWEPGKGPVAFATACVGTGPWTAIPAETTATGCAAPWSTADSGYVPGVRGWIDLDPSALSAGCGGPPLTAYRKQLQDPKTLSIQIASGAEGRAVHVRRREIEGFGSEGEFVPSGLGPWTTLALRSDVAAAGAVLEVPMTDVIGTATHAVVVEVDVAAPDGAASSTVVQIAWPLNC